MRIGEDFVIDKCHYVRVIYEGSGNPAEEHKIAGIEFLDIQCNPIHTIGSTKDGMNRYLVKTVRV